MIVCWPGSCSFGGAIAEAYTSSMGLSLRRKARSSISRSFGSLTRKSLDPGTVRWVAESRS